MQSCTGHGDKNNVGRSWTFEDLTRVAMSSFLPSLFPDKKNESRLSSYGCEAHVPWAGQHPHTLLFNGWSFWHGRAIAQALTESTTIDFRGDKKHIRQQSVKLQVLACWWWTYMHALVYPAILTRLVFRSLQSCNEKYNIIEVVISLHNRYTRTYSSLPLKETSSELNFQMTSPFVPRC